MSKFPRENSASVMISATSENGATTPTPDFHKNDAGRFEVLLHETLLNPAQPTMSSSMFCSTKRCRTLSWERTMKTSTEMPTAAYPRRLPLPPPSSTSSFPLRPQKKPSLGDDGGG